MAAVQTDAAQVEGAAEGLKLFERILLIRRFEEEVQRLFLRGEVYGTTHLCIGQEAVSVGVCDALGPRDIVTATYRGHGHTLALGTAPGALMAEMLGRTGGVCGGRAGSMNVVDRQHRLLGCFGIVGGSLAAATGAGLTLHGDAVAVAFFGDGAVNQAYFMECLNFAQVRGIPLLAVCENNQYGEYTAGHEVTPGGILARVRALEIPAERVDGNDVWGMRDAAATARAAAVDARRPMFLEAFTYRFSGHGRGDPVEYRPPGELERWRERDPLLLTESRLVGELGVPAERVQSARDEVERRIQQACEYALGSPFPEPDPAATEFSPYGA